MTGAASAAPDPGHEPLLERRRELTLVRELVRGLCGAEGAGGSGSGDSDSPGGPVGSGGSVGSVGSSGTGAGGAGGPAIGGVPGPLGAAGTGQRGSVLLFEGAAGLGKTTLMDATRRIVTESGCTVLYARGGEREQGRAFHVVRQLFRRLLVACDDAERHELLGGWWDMVAPAVGLAPAAPDDELAPPDPQGVRDALDWLMAGLSQRRGCMAVLVDDAHWADRESLAWLEAFTRSVESMPVLVVVSRRPEEPTPNTDLLGDLAALAGPQRLMLAPLSGQAVAELVRARLGDHADDAFCAQCHVSADGNPYVVGQLIGEMLDRDLKPTAANARHLDAIAAAIVGRGMMARLERTGSEAMRLARAVAVLGADATLGRAASLAGLAADDAVGPADRLRAVRVLAGDEQLEFAHPTIATEVYRRIPPQARGALHARAARLLVGDGHDDAQAAAHLLATYPSGDPWVVARLRSAAWEDLRAGAPDAAYRNLLRALNEPPFGEERTAVLYELGLAAFVHDPRAAIEHLYAALTCAHPTQPIRQAIVIRLAKALAHDDRMAEAVHLVDAEARTTRLSRARLRLQAEHFLWALFWVQDTEAHARARRLRSLAGRLAGADTTERCLLGIRAWYGVVRGDPAVQVIAYAERAMNPPLRWVDEDWGFEFPILTALAFLYADQPDRAEAFFQDGIAELEARGWRGTHLSFGHTLLAHIRYRQGRLAEAEAGARAGLELADRLGPDAPARWYALGTLLQILIAIGRLDEAEQLADRYGYGEPFPQAVIFPVPQVVRGELRLARHQYAAAAEDFAEAGQLLDARGASNPAWCPWRPYLALALAEEDPAGARRAAQRAVGQAYVFGAPSTLGQTLRVAGQLIGGAEGLAKLGESVRWLADSPARYEYALSLVEFGAALRRSKRITEARLRLGEGLEAAVRCGAEALAVRARAELLAAGGRPRRAYRTGVEALTARERQTAELVVRGLSNTSVARELAVQLGTVQKHLTAVYAKLGTDRDGLAECLVRSDVPAPRGYTSPGSR
ncbi:ATP-binding protein [Yinghuangia soli]|uniref:AAA family ATPase n=1 Tax=Yinghuangia soli TaxID=2908204 RepID=A0AA41PXS5_9ACTN|nr:AAA family ATPase [Yinghuangia soli]MCF2527809.1 AAA family ATPase [Yinghuangia soli]